MKRKLIILSLPLLLLTTGCNKQPETKEEQEPVPKTTEKLYPDIYINKVKELARNNPDLTYNLIYINNDQTPELVASLDNYYISIYTIKNDAVHPFAEELPYGAFGNAGYEYIQKENIIRNYNSDFAGLIVYTYYYKMDDEMNMVPYYDKELAEYYFNDTNGNGIPDDGEYAETNINLSKFLYGDKEITEKEYNQYLIDGTYAYIKGLKTADEIINTLNSQK